MRFRGASVSQIAARKAVIATVGVVTEEAVEAETAPVQSTPSFGSFSWDRACRERLYEAVSLKHEELPFRLYKLYGILLGLLFDVQPEGGCLL